MNDKGSLQDIENLLASATERMESVRDLTGEVRDLRGTGTSSDGRVRAEVMPGGALHDLTIDPRVMRMSSDEASEAILEAIRAATADATEQLGEVLEKALPGAGAGIADMATDQEADPEVLQSRLEASVQDIVDSLGRSVRR